MSDYLSKKISFFSFFLMILVILLHAQNISNRFPNFKDVSLVNRIIQSLFSGGICQIAVPFFFLISGYLYFNSTLFDFNIYLKKSKSRIVSLVIPFLLTSITGLSIFILLQKVPFLSSLFNNKISLGFNLPSIVNAVIINPQSYQLWFLRELIIVSFFFTPLIYLFTKYLKIIFTTSLFIIWLFFSKEISLGILPALCFFSIGSYLALFKINLNIKILKSQLGLLFLFWIISIALYFYFQLFSDFILNISISIGIFCVWWAYDIFDINKIKTPAFFTYSFFLYLFHEPFLTFFIKIIFKIFRNSLNIASFISYLVAPTITIFLVLVLAIEFKKRLAYLYNIYVGKR